MRRICVAIDGPSGVGKSTTARSLAEKLRLQYVDTGAMYRAVAVVARRQRLDLDDEQAVADLVDGLTFEFPVAGGVLRTRVDGEDLSDAIRTPEASMDASTVSRLPGVRRALVALQQKIASRGGVVMEGRDIGTVVLPDADIKFFLDADPEVRGRRRYLELVARGVDAKLSDVVEAVRLRDHQDRNRKVSPLRPADDAMVIDTTDLDAQEVSEHLLRLVERFEKAF